MPSPITVKTKLITQISDIKFKYENRSDPKFGSHYEFEYIDDELYLIPHLIEKEKRVSIFGSKISKTLDTD